MPIRRRKYLIFPNQEALNAIFSYKNTLVHKTFYGEYLFVREKGAYFAFSSTCPHQGKPLQDCWIENGSVVCPFHQFHFSMQNGRGHGLYLDQFELEINEKGVFLVKEKWSLF
ncbi:MAG: Rieske (2Fe-2S) protein [Bacteroidota bacterium]